VADAPLTRSSQVLKSVIAIAVLGLAVPLTVLAATGSERRAGPARALAAPALATPAGSADVDAAPVFSWGRVRRAALYEFQLAADPGFRSNVLGRNAETLNTALTLSRTLADGDYHWRVRAIRSNGDAGRWSRARSFTKSWSTRPDLLGPVAGTEVNFPSEPLVLRWDNVPHAASYVVTIAADPALATPVIGSAERPVETQGTSIAPGGTLPPGQYWWAVTPVDSGGHRGARSPIGSFTWIWPSGTDVHVSDANGDPRVFDPLFSWAKVPGAARYEVEVNSSEDFAVGSRVCCSDKVIGSALSPKALFPNNTYFWRVRAFDTDGVSGIWNVGAPFKKEFDDVSPDPAVPSLTVRDNQGPIATGSTTNSPVVTWGPVAGAASYEYQVVPHVSGGCIWNNHQLQGFTATTAWTPLEDDLAPGASYCVGVRARSGDATDGKRVVSEWTYLNGLDAASFTYTAPPAGGSTKVVAAASDYLEPASGASTSRMPLFTWKHVAGACAYSVVVAKDAEFTNIVDSVRTTSPAYAPRADSTPKTYPDETTSYYWAVVPVVGPPACNTIFSVAGENHPQSFLKGSVPPSANAPTAGTDVSDQPTFRWGGAEGAIEYRLQVANDPSFGSLVDNVVTTSTAYTSSSTYPADALLYWRVRADDERGVGLTWSPVQTFRRRLPAPQPLSGPDRGDQIPLLSWSLVPGAISYDVAVEEPDGDNLNFDLHSTAFAASRMYGVGLWKWRVRANFPGGTSGPYSGFRDFTRVLNPPTGAHVTRANGSLVLRWDPSYSLAEKYRVEFSTSSSFTRTIESVRVENTAYAPALSRSGYKDGGRLFWRVAAVDGGGNVGAWATGRVGLLRRMVVGAGGSLRRGQSALVEVRVRDARGRAVSRARVTLRGAGLNARSRRTSRRGIAHFRLTPRSSGRVTVRADKGGFRPASDVLTVR